MKPLICNLKMNHDLQEMIAYKKALDGIISPLWLAPATCYIPLMHSKDYHLCAQDVSASEIEKNTGSTSIRALKSLDVKGVLIGHTELNMTCEEKITKVKLVVKSKRKAFMIISDTQEEFDYQYTYHVLYNQMEKVLDVLIPSDYENIIFIYEPSFLVGSYHSLNPEFVSNLFYQLKMTLEKQYNFSFPIYYGGGLTNENIEPFLTIENVDGLLLGSVANDPKNIINLLKNDKTRH